MNDNQEVIYIHLDDIIPNRFQPRELFDEKALKELAVSIKEHGVIQPIIVRKISESKYEIIAGERRYKASALAGLTTIPAIIRNLDDKEAAKVALLENLQRRNLNPIEEARTYQKIIELDDMTQEGLAKTMGKSQSAVANKLRLLSLTEEVQKSLLKEEISERHARTLLNLNDHDKQVEMLKKVIKQKMTVRQLENEIKEINMNDDKIKDEKDLKNLINPTPVSIESNNLNKMPSFLMTPPNDSKNSEIINYGEIDNEEEENEKYPDLNGDNSSLLSKPINLMDLRNNTKDLEDINSSIDSKTESNNKSDLDTLLNIKPTFVNDNNEDNKKFTPAEEALRESENKNYNNKEDYFSAPNLMSIELPNTGEIPKSDLGDMFSNQAASNNSLIEFAKSSKPTTDHKESLVDINQTLFQKPIKEEQKINKSNKSLGNVLMDENLNNNKRNGEEEYNIRQIVDEIRKTLKNLELHGAKIDTDEMNFENQYQILIRIDKNSNY